MADQMADHVLTVGRGAFLLHWIVLPLQMCPMLRMLATYTCWIFGVTETTTLLRRVALRAGAFMISQCATEHVNKIPKELWSSNRLSASVESFNHDVFIRANTINFFPPSTFKWKF